MNPLLILLLLCFCVIDQGCVSTPNFSQYYRSKTPLLKAPSRVTEQSVTGTVFRATTNTKPDPRALAMENDMILKQHYMLLGIYSFEGARVLTGQELTGMTASKGGDYYIYVFAPNGMKTGTRMVMTGFTTPSMITSTSQGSAYGNLNGTYQNNYGGYGTMSGNASSYGYGSSQTVVGGSQTFQAQPYSYEALGYAVMVFASPQQQWKLIHDGVLSVR